MVLICLYNLLMNGVNWGKMWGRMSGPMWGQFHSSKRTFEVIFQKRTEMESKIHHMLLLTKGRSGNDTVGDRRNCSWSVECKDVLCHKIGIRLSYCQTDNNCNSDRNFRTSSRC